MTGRRRRSMDELLQAQEEHGRDAGNEPRATAMEGGTVAVVQASSVPDPLIASNEGNLSADERGRLLACEHALDNLRLAFAAAGKALQVIRDGRLYRATHPTFEAYVEDRWGMARGHAYRLIAAWPLAELLSPIGDSLNESQVRELVPFATQHGDRAAEIVYRAVAETEGVKVTAGLLKGAIAALPQHHFDPDQAVPEIRAYLSGENGSPAAPPRRVARSFKYQAARVLHEVERVASLHAINDAANTDPEEVRRFIGEARRLLDSMERQLSP
jgi:hypothetical protein